MVKTVKNTIVIVKLTINFGLQSYFLRLYVYNYNAIACFHTLKEGTHLNELNWRFYRI